MVGKDVEALKAAIRSVKASNWNRETKDRMLKSLDEQLTSYYGEITKSATPIEHEIAQDLVLKTQMPEDLKEKMLNKLDDIYGLEYEQEQAAKQARLVKIHKIIESDPQIKLLKSVARARKTGEIGQKDAMRFLDKVYGMKHNY